MLIATASPGQGADARAGPAQPTPAHPSAPVQHPRHCQSLQLARRQLRAPVGGRVKAAARAIQQMLQAHPLQQGQQLSIRRPPLQLLLLDAGAASTAAAAGAVTRIAQLLPQRAAGGSQRPLWHKQHAALGRRAAQQLHAAGDQRVQPAERFEQGGLAAAVGPCSRRGCGQCWRHKPQKALAGSR